jgi:signal transduction histidine kinase/CheY-like chemotaxis protein/PAS domain-containing protein
VTEIEADQLKQHARFLQEEIGLLRAELSTLRGEAKGLEPAPRSTGAPAAAPTATLTSADDDRYRTLLNTIDTGFCIIELRFDDSERAVDYRILEGNPAHERMTGLYGTAGKWVSEFAPQLERHWFDTYGRVALTGEAVRFENAAVSLSRWFDVQALRIGDPGDHRVAVLFNDISQRRQAELALARSEAHWRSLFENLSEGFVLGEVMRDETGKVVDLRYIDVNAAWGVMVERDPNLARQRTYRELFNDGEQWVEETARVVDTGIPVTFTRQVGSAGRWYQGRTHRFDNGRFATLFREVTDSYADEARRNALLELSDRLRDMQDIDEMAATTAEILGRTLHASRAGYGVIDTDQQTMMVNGDWTAPGIASVAGQHDLPGYGNYIDALLNGQTISISDTRTDPRTIESASTLLRFDVRALINVPLIEQGRTVAMIFVNAREPREWTTAEAAFALEVAERTRGAIERRRAEQDLRSLNARLEGLVAARTADLAESEHRLRQSQKMEAVGQLTGGLAHDFNNLLSGIGGSLELLQLRLQEGRFDGLDRYINAAQSSSKRAAALTHRLLAFSRRQTLAPRPTDINRLVMSMEELVRRTVGPAIDLQIRPDAHLWPTLVDPNQLENALLNLCINARDAMPNGGQLVVETANLDMDQPLAQRRELPPGAYVELSVSDNGSGMAPGIVAKAFDPFFTTKPIGMGTGLGLSMIYGFARQTGGQVNIQSREGEGTRVSIYLPRYAGEAERPGSTEPVTEPPRAKAGETVLVVDDEPTIRMLVSEVLHDLGYAAIEAADGPSGLKVLKSDTRIDLLISDVGLPGGMNGRQMADAARAVRPDLKVLFITGYADNSIVGSGRLDDNMYVMTKPFAMDQLAVRIQQLIRTA